MRVFEVMTKGVQSVTPNTAAADAWELMRRKGIHHLVVKGEGGVIGVLSDRDAGGRGGASLRARSRVSDLMSASVVTVDSRATVRKVANMMRGRTIGCVPVIDRGRLVGILTATDLLELLGRGIDRPAQPQRHNLNHRVPHRKHRVSYGAW